MKKRSRNILLCAGLLLGVLMTAGGGITGARAALNYYSKSYVAEIGTDRVGVSLLENGQEIASEARTGVLFSGSGDFTIEPGKAVSEVLTAKNTGSREEYVRAEVVARWIDAGTHEPLTDLDPSFIRLSGMDASWKEQSDSKTPERRVYALSEAIPAGSVSKPFATEVAIDPAVLKDEAYSRALFEVSVSVQAVQGHNGTQARKSVWGRIMPE